MPHARLIHEFRRQMAVVDRWVYLDHAAVAPLPRCSAKAIGDWSQQASTQGDTAWPQWAKQVETVRHLAARLINARPEEIAITPNTTTSIGYVAEGYPWRSGENVVALGNEFPSNLYPWMHLASRGVDVRIAPVADSRVDISTIEPFCDAQTRLLSLSWVGYATGWRINLEEIIDWAHRRGILVLLDAIQGMGVFPLDVAGLSLDFLAADGHKWMLGPEGAGIFYVKTEHLDRLRPLHVGWNSVENPYDFSQIDLRFRRTAARYEGGSQNMVGIFGLGAGLELLEKLGLAHDQSPLGECVLQITDYAATRLQEIGAKLLTDRNEGHRSGILTFQIPGQDPQTLRNRCLAAGVVLSHRGGGLRISPHAYNTPDDIDRLLDVLQG